MLSEKIKSLPISQTVAMTAKAHDLKNLYLCGPSIFPEPSYSNPMLMIVAMSLRLGNYLTEDILK